ncbi:hypothetical protein DESC_740237 [Desulfosarcina cetonica]|nr:hypothetical protein DESC_740237 [Desulfosarcina cetonica]
MDRFLFVAVKDRSYAFLKYGGCSIVAFVARRHLNKSI